MLRSTLESEQDAVVSGEVKSQSSAESTSTLNKFVEQKYPETHWAVDKYSCGTCLAFVKYRSKYNFVMKLNPTDCRGYRTLVFYFGDDATGVQNAFNRPYTVAEQRGLSDVVTIMTEVYKKLDLAIVQSVQAGNNVHSLLPSGAVQIGNESDPSTLHMHMWARGNTEHEYIPGIPLRGPTVGDAFELVPKNSTGVSKKVKWQPKEQEKAMQVMKDILEAYCASAEFQEEFGGVLTVDIIRQEPTAEKSSVCQDAPVSLTAGPAMFAQSHASVNDGLIKVKTLKINTNTSVTTTVTTSVHL